VNYRGGKNLIGAIHQPRAVLIDPTLVHTLPRREITAALAEIIKTAAISNRKFFQFVAHNIQSLADLTDMKILEETIIQACRVKAQVVEQDEREGNRRRILNFGHTLGHALEATVGYNTIRHGEAVGLGMVAAGYISTAVTGLSEQDLELLITPITFLDLPRIPIPNFDSLKEFLHYDKKIRQGIVHFVLLQTIGQPIISADVSDEQIKNALAELERRFG
jgi:3-dehydroquinate synthase